MSNDKKVYPLQICFDKILYQGKLEPVARAVTFEICPDTGALSVFDITDIWTSRKDWKDWMKNHLTPYANAVVVDEDTEGAVEVGNSYAVLFDDQDACVDMAIARAEKLR